MNRPSDVFYKTFGKRQAKKDDPSAQFLKMSGIRMRRHPRRLVEDCEVITVSTPGELQCTTLRPRDVALILDNYTAAR